jgi:hypothetical protein
MRRFLVVLLAGVMILGMSSALLAAEDESTIQVTVASIDALVVTDGGTITLDDVSGNDITGDPDTTATLSYTHNSGNNRMILAEVEADGMPIGTQDITLTVQVAGGEATPVNLVVDGARNVGQQAVWNNIPRRCHSEGSGGPIPPAPCSGTNAGSNTFNGDVHRQDQT